MLLKMLDIHKKFCKETFDHKGHLINFEPVYENNFNFAYDVVDAIAAETPDKRAMVWTDDSGNDKIFTFKDFSVLSNQTANYFLDAGIKKGDKVLIVLKRHYQFWIAILALHKIGAVGVPSTNLLTTKDYIYRLNSANIKAVIATTDGDVIKNIDNALVNREPINIKISVKGSVPGWLDFDNTFTKYPDKFDRIETLVAEPILLYFTSGTTGMPKMVLHDHSYPIAHIITAKYWHNVDPDGLHLTISDTGWLKSMWGKLYGQWLMEAAVFVCDFNKFIPSEILTLFAKYKITTFCAPPTMYRFFIKEDLKQYDLSSLKYATTAGEPLNPEVFTQFYNATGLRLMEGFGQSETTLTIFTPLGTEPVPGSMGIPSPAYNLDIVDDKCQRVSAGTVGEIVIRTENGKPCGMFGGYYENDELTNTVWYDNIYHTGDTAWYDEDGYIWFVGRSDDIIKSSGYRIGPFEIESVVLEHPSCLECAVTGVPDPIRGQIVKATIVLAKGYEPSESLKKEIQKYVKENTAPYKYPRVIEFVPELPKTISGKIQRVKIRESKA